MTSCSPRADATDPHPCPWTGPAPFIGTVDLRGMQRIEHPRGGAGVCTAVRAASNEGTNGHMTLVCVIQFINDGGDKLDGQKERKITRIGVRRRIENR